jgi:hypothetical protein
VTQYNEVNSLKKRLAALERQIKELSSAPRLSHSSIHDGGISEYDSEGNLVSRIGQQHDGTHGAVDIYGPKPPTPTDPTLSSAPVSLTINWDGHALDDDGEPRPLPLDFQCVQILAAKGAPPASNAVVGVITSEAGGAKSLTVDAGTWHVALRMRAKSGRVSDQTAVVTVDVPDVLDTTAVESQLAQAQADAIAALSGASDAQIAAQSAFNEATSAASAAEAAANDAAAAAGLVAGKGKVIIQSATPDTADQLPQNLWIDTTGGANTPKRWTGSTWEAVSDKLAVDAAASAATAEAAADQAAADAAAAAVAAGNAQTAANGKNRVWYTEEAPPGNEHQEGDTWFNTAAGNLIFRWDGSTWQPAALSTSAIADGAITSTKIGELDASRITSGTIDVNRLDANSITTDKLLIASVDNLVEDPGFETFGTERSVWGEETGWTLRDPEGGRTGAALKTNMVVITHTVTSDAQWRMAMPGAYYRLSMWVRSELEVTTSGITPFIEVENSAGDRTRVSGITGEKTLSAGAWTFITSTALEPLPSDAVRIRPVIEVLWSAAFEGAFWFDQVSVTRAAGGMLLVDGSITADKLAAGAITADTIEVGALDGQVITAGVFKSSDSVGQTNTTTMWLGTPNNSASTVSGVGFSTRTNKMPDPAGVNPTIWAQTPGGTAAAGANLFGRGGTVFSSAGTLTSPLLSPSNGSLAISGQFDTQQSIEAYVHEANTSRDGTLFTKIMDRPSGAASNATFFITKGGRFAWVAKNTALTGNTLVTTSSKTGTGVNSLTAAGTTLTYGDRVISPTANVIWTASGLDSTLPAILPTNHPSYKFTGTVTVRRVSTASGGTVSSHTVGQSAAEGGHLCVGPSGDLYAVWSVNESLTSSNPYVPRTRATGYIRRITPDGTVTTDTWYGPTTNESYFASLTISNARPATSNGVFVVASVPGDVSPSYFRVTNTGSRSNSTETAFNAPPATYPDDLNGSAVTFTYSLEDSPITGTPVARTDAQVRYLEHPATKAIWTFDRTRAKHAVDLGTAFPSDNGRARWLKSFNWSTIPSPVVTFRTTARGSSFIAENTGTHSFWFSGSAADAGGGAGGVLDAQSLRGYTDNGGLATELDFSTGTLTAHNATIDGVVQSADGAGTKFTRLAGGIFEAGSGGTTRASIHSSSASDPLVIETSGTPRFKINSSGQLVPVNGTSVFQLGSNGAGKWGELQVDSAGKTDLTVGVYARRYLGSNQLVSTNSVHTTVLFPDIAETKGISYSNGFFTVDRAGLYYISSTVVVAGSISNTAYNHGRRLFRLMAGETELMRQEQSPVNTAEMSISLNGVVRFAAGETFDLRIFLSRGSGVSTPAEINLVGAEAKTFVQIARIGV